MLRSVMTYDFVIADVFSSTPFGGNQLAVFLDARGLSDRAMQSLAREINFAESTFLLPPSKKEYARRVRIFTPGAEMPFAGHPTVGTAAVLVDTGLVPAPGGTATLILEENVGPITVEVEKRGSGAAAHLWSRFSLERASEFLAKGTSNEQMARALCLSSGDVLESWYATAGLAFCFARLADSKAVDRAILDRGVWAPPLSDGPSPNLFLFAEAAPQQLYARMFAPAIGVDEDPATGSAAAALAGTLAARDGREAGEFTWQINQGVKLGRPSLIEASALKKGGKVSRIRVAGSTAIVGTGRITTTLG